MHELAPLKLVSPSIANWSDAGIPGRLRSGFDALHLKAGRVGDVELHDGLGLPAPLAFSMIGAVEALGIGPGEWLLMVPAQHSSELALLARALDERGIASARCESRIHILDLDAQADLITGLAGLPADALTPGRVVRTRLADIPVLIAATVGGAMRFIFDRTYAPHVRAWLDRAI